MTWVTVTSAATTRLLKFPRQNLDRLATEGLRFTDAHAPDSVCTPESLCLLTGRYCFRSRMKSGVLGPWGAPLIEEGRLTVPMLLRQHGYVTTCIGKWASRLDLAKRVTASSRRAPTGWGTSTSPARLLTGRLFWL